MDLKQILIIAAVAAGVVILYDRGSLPGTSKYVATK